MSPDENDEDEGIISREEAETLYRYTQIGTEWVIENETVVTGDFVVGGKPCYWMGDNWINDIDSAKRYASRRLAVREVMMDYERMISCW